MHLPRAIRDRLDVVAGGLPRPFWILWAGIFVNRIGWFVVPFLAIYLTQARGFSITQAGMVAAIYGAGAAISGPVGGYLADHIGRRFVMVGALGLGGLSMIALGFAHRIEVIAPFSFCVALITEMYRPAMHAALADLVPPRDRVRAFGLVYWVINLGVAIGLFLAGIIATVSFMLLFVGDGITSIVFALLVWRGVPETRLAHTTQPHDAPRVSALAAFFAPYCDPVFVAFLGLSLLFATLFMQGSLALPIDMTAHGVSRAAFGAVIALNGLVIVIAQPFLGQLLARWNRSHALAAGATLVAFGFGLNALARTAPVYAMGVIIWTIGEIGVLPVANAVVADLAPREIRGRYQGAYSLSFGLAACAAPTVGSLVIQRFGATALWCGCLGVGLLIAIGHLALAGPLTRAREARRAA